VSCCPPRGAEPFTEKLAARDLKRFRRRGLDPTARALVEAVEPEGTVLEIGGGVGALHLELVRRGAGRATNVELSPAYEHAAAELAREQGFEERVDRRVLDFTQSGGELEPADVVVLHRVVCCSPDVDALVGGAAKHARRALGLTFPIDAWWTRLIAFGFNTGARLLRWEWRFYVHREDAIAAAAEREGLRRTHDGRRRIWRIAVFVRA
jgi:magnesium-protoporphyrin O-methyltransferase